MLIRRPAHPQDDGVIAACNEYKMGMAFTNVRLFHH